MSKGKTDEWLKLWHQLLDDPSMQPFKEPRDMAGVLADFRHDPERLAKAFGPLPHVKGVSPLYLTCSAYNI